MRSVSKALRLKPRQSPSCSRFFQLGVKMNISDGASLFRCGVISDTQYVDADDGTTFDGSSVRRYRQSLSTLANACFSYLDINPSCCIMLGDILDGKSKALNMEEKCLSELLDLTTTTGCPWHYCIGNHDLVALSREKIYDALIPSELRTTCSPTRLYYDFCPHPGFRFVLLDGYDISTISATTKEHEQYAKILLSDNNPNLKDPHGDWLKGLSGPARRFVPFNGGVSQTQLDWLSSVLERAERAGERCFIFSHMPCHPGCCRTGGLIWNYEEVLSVLQKHSGTVVAVFSGHDHDGGYEIDETGIHHVVPAAPLECDEGELAYGHLAVYAHHCDVHWTGKTPASPPYRPWPSRLDYPPKKTT